MAARCSCRRAACGPATAPSNGAPPTSIRSSSAGSARSRRSRAGRWTKARVLIPAFGHVFRPGSRVRLAINTPGGDQATWSYELLDLPGGTQHRGTARG